MSEATSELEKLRAALAVAEGRAATAEAKLAQASAVVSASEAMIKALKLEIALLKRDKYGRSPERTARLLDQLELQLEELVADSAEDATADNQAVEKTTKVAGFERRKPVKKPFPEHLPRERVVVEAPTTCSCCGSDRIVKMGEDSETLFAIGSRTMVERNAGGDPAAVEGHSDRPREVHLPALREDQPATRPVPPDPAGLGRSQPARDDRVRDVRPASAPEPAGRTLCP